MSIKRCLQTRNHYLTRALLFPLWIILEKLIGERLECYLNIHRLYDNYRYTFVKGEPVDSALLNVHQDIAEATSKKCMVLLVLLDSH